MKVFFNTMVKNEGILLDKILPIWKTYPVDKFIFYNDNSSDNTIEIIKKHLESKRYKILNDNLEKFHEAHHRSRMLEYSREESADFVLSIDADELLSSNLVSDFFPVLNEFNNFDIYLYWYNVVEEKLTRIRQDKEYKENYRSFILPLKHTGKFNLNLWKYHTPRVPNVNLPKIATKQYGVIHLQAMNVRYYALKQLWYKHYEYKEYNHNIIDINSGYDKVINNLNFESIDTPNFIIKDLNFDSNVFDEIEKIKKYKDYILSNYVEELVTFGKKYLVE